ncbi:MAG: PIN domain-containing protein [Nostoc sp.]|uniref:PIN domain-containing protein n=1 Tax=Nostoc sp. TaxID=1180 RepID=UPI002FF5B6FB
MRYLLDTNICIYLIKEKPQKVLDKFQTLSIYDVGISSITIAELEYGCMINLLIRGFWQKAIAPKTKTCGVYHRLFFTEA